MTNEQIISEIKSKIIDLTYFSFHIEEATDDGGKTIDIYVIPDDMWIVKKQLLGMFGKARLIFYAMEEEDILHLHDKNM
tara:strand:+ start:672 stop:908 length:237 start_codon:yes stop_codon:yes gene_type:complete